MKHLSSKVYLLDYKAHDHNKIMHRERDEHIATGRALSLEEVPCSSWESATVMEMVVEIDGDGSRGTSPSWEGAGTKTFCP